MIQVKTASLWIRSETDRVHLIVVGQRREI